MFKQIVTSIICSEFDKAFGRNSCNQLSDPDNAMIIKFSLSPHWDKEEGYRNLTILIFGGGSNYISVFAKLDWNVAPVSDTAMEYQSGATPWVLQGCHDSCWRDAVGNLLSEYRERINSIDWVFGGWYKRRLLSLEDKKELATITHNTPGYGGEGKRVKLADLDFVVTSLIP